MTRQARHREDSQSIWGGSYGSYTRDIVYYTRTCDDYHGKPYIDSPFHSVVWKHNPVRISGFGRDGIPVTGFVPDNHLPGGLEDWPGGVPSLSHAISQTLANSNPNRRTVDMPVFLFELLDLPKMLKSVGEDLLTLAAKRGRKPKRDDFVTYSAGKNLEVQFGWIPLISDLGKMMDFQNIVKKRVEELQRLGSNKGLRRRFTVWEDELYYQGGTTLQSSNFHASCNWTVRNRGKCWATLRWKPDKAHVDYLPYTDEYILRSARRATLDLDTKLRQGIDAASAWEAIPFSWLIDYFTNVGDTLQSDRNEIPVTPTDMCVMYQLSSYADFNQVSCNYELIGQPGTTTRTSKDRYVIAAPSSSLSANFGFLSPKQWSILGSLAVLNLVGINPQVQL